MNILIAGVDGYLGWPLAEHLAALGHHVSGIDNGLRRRLVAREGSDSATPIASFSDRASMFKFRFGSAHGFLEGDLSDYSFCVKALTSSEPDAIVHLAQIPSAPYSMGSVDQAVFTQVNNVTGTLHLLHAMRDVAPGSHLVKLGTMGEYGTPDIDIPEGFFEVDFRGKRAKLPFPRQAGSWYHQSKVHDSNNIAMACRVWGLRSTDVMQGVVYGVRGSEDSRDDRWLTRFDFDQCFGTAINRFCAQAVIGEPITVYGSGLQRRGFLPLKDSLRCLTLAIENPPKPGEYRVFNQFENVYRLKDLAELVRDTAFELGFTTEISHLENPREEAETHYYNPDHQKLFDLGYKPTTDMRAELMAMLTDLSPYAGHIGVYREALLPTIRWSGYQGPPMRWKGLTDDLA